MNISRGYVRLFRQIDEWEWYDNPFVKAIFLHCLIKANDKAKKWRDLTLKRGQFVTSYEKLAAANGITIQQTRTALKQLQLTNEIEYQSTNQYTVITVKNFNLYQATNIQKTKADTQPTNKQNEGQVTTTNNINNREIIINNNLSLCEREILKKYLLSRKRKEPIYDIDAYIALIVKNGSLKDKLEKALKWHEKQTKENVITFTPPEKVEQTTEERGKIAEVLKKTKATLVKKIRKGD